MKEEILNKLFELKKTDENNSFFSTIIDMRPWENSYQEGFLLHLGTIVYFLSLLIFLIGLIYLLLKILFKIGSYVTYSDLQLIGNDIKSLSDKLNDMDKSDFHLLSKDNKKSLYKNVKKELNKKKLKFVFSNIAYYFNYSNLSFMLIIISLFIFNCNWLLIYIDYKDGLKKESISLFENYMEKPEIFKSEIKRFEKLSDNEFLVIYKDSSSNEINQIYSGSFKFNSDISNPYYEYEDRFNKEELKNTLIYDELIFNNEETNYSKQFNFGKSGFIIALPNNFDINNPLKNK